MRKSFFEAFCFTEKHPEILFAFKVFHQQRFRQHRADRSFQRDCAAFPAQHSFKVPEHSFHDIVGSLRLNKGFVAVYFAWNGIGEQLFTVFFDLIEHFSKESLKLLRASIPSSIRIRECFPEEIDSVVADPTRIHQLLINLCNNAAHAMNEEGGCLTIGLSNVELDFEAASKHPDLKPGSYVLFSLSDTGYGIPSNMLDKIFEPYFTTKEVGKGTGLGLAVVHGIVKAHNGAIGIESSVGEGTAFHVYFPSSKAATNKKEKEKIPFPAGTEKILFVDDEESIVKLYAKILPNWGYTVHSDTDPAKILDRFQSDPFAYDLVVSDMTMPNLTGDRLARELLKTRPDIPIIICTGYHEKISPEKIEKMGIKGLLMKPVETAKLSAMIREILDEAKNKIRE